MTLDSFGLKGGHSFVIIFSTKINQFGCSFVSVKIID